MAIIALCQFHFSKRQLYLRYRNQCLGFFLVACLCVTHFLFPATEDKKPCALIAISVTALHFCKSVFGRALLFWFLPDSSFGLELNIVTL